MFESLKKKFSRTSDQLEEELKTEAEQENNISDEKEGKKRSFFSFGRKKEEKKEEDIVDEEKKDTFDEKDSETEQLGAVDEKEDSSSDESENKKSRFWSFSSKDSSKEDLEDSDEKEDYSSEDNNESGEKKSRFWSSSNKDSSDNEEEKSEKKSHFWNRSKKEDEDKDKDESKEEKKEEESSGGLFSFIREKTISEKHVENILWDLEMSLLEADVAMEVASEVVNSVQDDLVGKKIKRSNDITEYTFNALRDAVAEIIDIDGESMTEMIEEKKAKGEPLVVMFVGINGTGKTTTIGKLANYYQNKGYTPVIAASDTFRAGAIEQVTHHADNVGVKIIKHQKGSDPAAVAFDAVEHAKSQGKELVLIDTAGRMQTNTNLMDEMKKIKRVSKPDLVVFVGDALTGNDATEQARKFNDAIDIDGVILTKADADSKGGASLSIGYVIKKPILFLGMGQGYDDIMEYDSEWMLDQLFSDDEEVAEVE